MARSNMNERQMNGGGYAVRRLTRSVHQSAANGRLLESDGTEVRSR